MTETTGLARRKLLHLSPSGLPGVRRAPLWARRAASIVSVVALVSACAAEPPAQGQGPAAPRDYGPSDEAVAAGGLATGAVLALIAVAAIAGTASLVVVSNP